MTSWPGTLRSPMRSANVSPVWNSSRPRPPTSVSRMRTSRDFQAEPVVPSRSARRLPSASRGRAGRHGRRLRGRANLAGPPRRPESPAVRGGNRPETAAAVSDRSPGGRPSCTTPTSCRSSPWVATEGVHFYAMQFVDGRSLAAIVQRATVFRRAAPGVLKVLSTPSASIETAKKSPPPRTPPCRVRLRLSWTSLKVKPRVGTRTASSALSWTQSLAVAARHWHRPLWGRCIEDRAFCRHDRPARCRRG